MNVEEELVSFLINIERKPGQLRLDGTPRKMREQDPDLKRRDMSIVLDNFSFGRTFWPTLKTLSEQYEVGSRERVRQIIQSDYTDRLDGQQLPAAKAAAEVLPTKELWAESEYLAELQSRGLVGPLSHAVGLVNYFHTQSLATDYEIYLPDLRAATRGSYLDYGERVIVNKARIEDLRNDLAVAESIPGRSGLAKLSHVLQCRPEADVKILSDLIRFNTQAWSAICGDEVWYAFENRENVLCNNAAKTFKVTRACPLNKLAEILANSLKKRTPQFGYPETAVISTWITQSKQFTVTDDMVSLNGLSKELTTIESAVVELMEGKGPITSDSLITTLEANGFSKPAAHQNVYNSPLVYVDKSGGRTNYRFTLVSDIFSFGPPTERNFYDIVRERLRNLGGTDRDAIVSMRREQPILAEWIFRDDEHGECAICRRRFAVGALVVAHKKKRMHCTEAERLDPHIVFPLCTFGCDYLYENGFVTVRDGAVVLGREPAGDTEIGAVRCLVGVKVDPRWIEGRPSYFDNLVGCTRTRRLCGFRSS